MPWNGYNYEDAILISEELVREDKFTSIHIRSSGGGAETKLGPKRSPATSQRQREHVEQLDDEGIIRIGRRSRAAPSWWARSRPKRDGFQPEFKLLTHLRGEGQDVRDTSLRVPPASRHGHRRAAPEALEGDELTGWRRWSRS